MSDLTQARAAKEHLRALLGHRADVVGVGVARTPEGYCLKVNLREQRTTDPVPPSVDGVEVRTVVVGRIGTQA